MQTRNNEQNIVTLLWSKYFPYWPLFLLLILLFSGAAWAYLQYKAPLYEATASILIKDEKKGVDDSKMIESLNLITTKKIVENEIEVLKSKTLMGEVVKSLALYAPVYKKGSWRNVPAYASSPVKIEAKNTNALTEVKEVPIHWNASTSDIVINRKQYDLDEWVETPYGTLKFTRTHAAQPDTDSLYFSIVNPKKVTAGLLSSLNITSTSKLSTVVSLSIKDESPQRGEAILNKLIEVYNKAAVTDKNALASNTLSFVEERLSLVAASLDSIERRLQEYKSRRGAVDISQQGQLFLQNVSSNNQKVSDVNIQLAALDQVERYIYSKESRGGIVPSTFGISDPLLSQLLTRLYEAELEYEKLRKTTADNNPMVVAVSGEIQKIKPSILENIQSQRRSLQASKANLHATNNSYSSLLQTIPQKERDIVEISRQQAIQSSIYSFLLQKREEAALSHSSGVVDNRVVDSAESSLLPVSPKKSIIYLAALVLAFGIGIMLITVKELFNQKVLFRSEVEEATSVPVVSELSYVKGKEQLLIGNPKHHFIGEQFRQLRAAIGLYGRNTTVKKLLITSSISGEGKSFMAANLALSLAQSGKKVVLLDLDLRNPKSSSLMAVREQAGVAEFLEGEAAVEEIVKETGYKNLSVVGAGGETANPTDLLLNSNLDDLFGYLEHSFDFIVVDTSPIDPVADAYVLSEYCDATLFVIRHGYTPKLMVQLLDSNQKIKALKNPSIVFNGVKSRGFLAGSFGYGYGYGYEYVYKNRTKKVQKTLVEG